MFKGMPHTHNGWRILKDHVLYTALLSSPAQVSVTIGGVTQKGTWDQEPFVGRVELYHGNVPLNGATGSVTVTISMAGTTIATVDNKPKIT